MSSTQERSPRRANGEGSNYPRKAALQDMSESTGSIPTKTSGTAQELTLAATEFRKAAGQEPGTKKNLSWTMVRDRVDHPAVIEPHPVHPFGPDQVAEAVGEAKRSRLPAWVFGTFEQNKRSKANVRFRSAGLLDADEPLSGEAWRQLESLGIRYLAHTTYTATEGKPKWRVIVPFSREVTPEEHQRITRWLMAKISAGVFDQSCDQAERLMFAPAIQSRRAFYEVDDSMADAPLLDVEEVLAGAPACVPTASNSRATDVIAGGLWDELRGDDEDPCKSMEAVVDEWIHRIDEAGEGSRHVTGMHAIGALVGAAAGDGHTGFPWAEEELRMAFRGKFDQRDGRTTDAEWDAMLLDVVAKQASETPERVSFLHRIECEGYGRKVTVEDILAAREEAQHKQADKLWTATPTMEKIRRAAHSRHLVPEGVLGACLTMVLVDTPVGVVLPPLVGATAPLNLGVALVGPSGSGKSKSIRVAGELLGIEDLATVKVPLGSGEGMAEAYMQSDQETDPGTGKKRQVRRLIDDPRRLFVKGEVDEYKAGMERQGSSIASVLREALTGEQLGQTNATADRTRNVPEGRYRACAIIGVQPLRSLALTADESGGTPQRFVWAPTTSDHKPEKWPTWPGTLGYVNPFKDWAAEYEVGIPAEIADEITKASDDIRWGGNSSHEAAEKSHLVLTREKVAVALALLHGERDITQQWWRLSGLVMDLSLETMRACKSATTQQARRDAATKGTMRAHERVAEDRAVAQLTETSEAKAARGMGRTVKRHQDDDRHQGKACTKKCLNDSAELKSKKGDAEGKARLKTEAIAWSESQGWLIVDGSSVDLGGSQPD